MKVVIAFLLAILGYIVLNRLIKPLPLGRWAMGLKWLCALGVFVILWVQSEVSIGKTLAEIWMMEARYQILDVATIAVIFCLYILYAVRLICPVL